MSQLEEDYARATRLLAAKIEEVIIQRLRADKAEGALELCSVMPCPDCKGEGNYVVHRRRYECQDCSGTGRVDKEVNDEDSDECEQQRAMRTGAAEAELRTTKEALAEARNLVRELCCEGEAESIMIAITNKARRFMAKWEQPSSPEGETE